MNFINLKLIKNANFFNKLKINKAHFSLNELFLVIKGELAPECLKENIKIELKVEDDIDAYGDVGLIKKSLIHLLKNSIQARCHDCRWFFIRSIFA